MLRLEANRLPFIAVPLLIIWAERNLSTNISIPAVFSLFCLKITTIREIHALSVHGFLAVAKYDMALSELCYPVLEDKSQCMLQRSE